MGFNFGDIFGSAAKAFAEQLGIQLVEQRLVVPDGDLQGITDAANAHIQQDSPSESDLTPAQVHAVDLAIIEYVTARVAKQL